MKIAAIVGVLHKVQHNRIKQLQKVMPDVHFDIFLPKKKSIKNASFYDAIYYTSYTLYPKCPISHPVLLTSVTSHKCVDNVRPAVRILKRFRRISANNRMLRRFFLKKKLSVSYIPNGVDIHTYKPVHHTFDPKNIKLGWTGNIDRAAKNFYSIIRPLKKKYNFSTVETRKGRKVALTPKQMCDFYNSIDFYIVASSTEGTPNPGLEAAACGIPIISTRVGNMGEIVEDNNTGFLVPTVKLSSIRQAIEKTKNIDNNKYQEMSKKIRQTIKNGWSWELRASLFRAFFKGV